MFVTYVCGIGLLAASLCGCGYLAAGAAGAAGGYILRDQGYEIQSPIKKEKATPPAKAEGN